MMKNKKRGLFSIGFMVVGIIFFGAYGIYTMGASFRFLPSGNIAMATHGVLPSKAVVNDIRRIDPELPGLIKLAEDSTPFDTRTFLGNIVDSEQEIVDIAVPDPEATLEVQRNNQLTFSFVSKSQRFCIIDGVFYPETAELPDGGIITKIETDRVWIKDGENVSHVPLADGVKGF
jgi:hypothetical protein